MVSQFKDADGGLLSTRAIPAVTATFLCFSNDIKALSSENPMWLDNSKKFARLYVQPNKKINYNVRDKSITSTSIAK